MLKIFLKIAAKIHNTDDAHIKNGHTEGTQNSTKPTQPPAENHDFAQLRVGPAGGPFKTVYIPRSHLNAARRKRSSTEHGDCK